MKDTYSIIRTNQYNNKKMVLEVQRKYRRWAAARDLVSFEAVKEESDLFISADKDLTVPAKQLIEECRAVIKDYIRRCPQFEFSLQPVEAISGAAPIIKEMIKASRQANVGPMAAVAGAISEYVGRGLLNFSGEVIVENGGDIFIKSSTDRVVGIYAGSSPFSGRISLNLKASLAPVGICTSSGTVGHSLSFGKSDSVTVISRSTLRSDAAATAVANIVNTPKDIAGGIELARSIRGIRGVLIVIGKKFGAWGEVEIVKSNRVI